LREREDTGLHLDHGSVCTSTTARSAPRPRLGLHLVLGQPGEGDPDERSSQFVGVVERSSQFVGVVVYAERGSNFILNSHNLIHSFIYIQQHPHQLHPTLLGAHGTLIRTDYTPLYLAHTVVFSHARPDKTETDSLRLYGKNGAYNIRAPGSTYRFIMNHHKFDDFWSLNIA
jgi:hypothetical protein